MMYTIYSAKVSNQLNELFEYDVFQKQEVTFYTYLITFNWNTAKTQLFG